VTRVVGELGGELTGRCVPSVIRRSRKLWKLWLGFLSYFLYS
jgi:hypothetical protein